MKNYYRILDIPVTAESRQIQTAYRKLAKKFHPDMNPNDPLSAEMFREIQHAYDILSDPFKKEVYDKQYQYIFGKDTVEKDTVEDMPRYHWDANPFYNINFDFLYPERKKSSGFPFFLRFCFLIEMLVGFIFFYHYKRLDLSSVPNIGWKIHLQFSLILQVLSAIHAAFQLFFKKGAFFIWHAILKALTAYFLIAPMIGMSLFELQSTIFPILLIWNVFVGFSIFLWILNEIVF
jgi:curved DNA-binding protein CbpA